MDFISQSTFSEPTAREELRRWQEQDALGHKERAQVILRQICSLPPGSMMGIVGSWGTGKSDLLARVALATYQKDCPEEVLPKALWINPWQYGKPDLLTPVVAGILSLMKQHSITIPENKQEIIKVQVSRKSNR